MTNGPHFGPRVVGDEQYKKEEKFFSSGAHHFGSRVTGEVAVAEPEPEFDWYALDVDEALEHLKSLGPPDLAKVQGMELNHPSYVGGRGMILDAIEEALG